MIELKVLRTPRNGGYFISILYTKPKYESVPYMNIQGFKQRLTTYKKKFVIKNSNGSILETIVTIDKFYGYLEIARIC